MAKKEIIIVAEYVTDKPLTFEEIREACDATSDFMEELIAYDILFPIDEHEDERLFDVKQLHRAKTTMRLQRDLGVNLASAALILDLLDEINTLREETHLIDRHLWR